MVNNLEIGIKKRDDGYSFSFEEDDKKRIYTIFSPELKQKVREIIFPFGTSDKGNDQYQGKNNQGDSIFYQRGKENLSDQLTLISGKDFGSKEITDKTEQRDKIERQKEEGGWENWDAEWEKTEVLWKKAESELGIPSSSGVKHYFSGRNSDGKIVVEGIYVSSEAQPRIQEITEEEVKKIEQENNDSKESFIQQQQVLTKK